VIKYVSTYRRKMRPRVKAKINEHAASHAEVVLLTSRRRTRRWLRITVTSTGETRLNRREGSHSLQAARGGRAFGQPDIRPSC
jgi:hypothetical protein